MKNPFLLFAFSLFSFTFLFAQTSRPPIRHPQKTISTQRRNQMIADSTRMADSMQAAEAAQRHKGPPRKPRATQHGATAILKPKNSAVGFNN